MNANDDDSIIKTATDSRNLSSKSLRRDGMPESESSISIGETFANSEYDLVHFSQPEGRGGKAKHSPLCLTNYVCSFYRPWKRWETCKCEKFADALFALATKCGMDQRRKKIKARGSTRERFYVTTLIRNSHECGKSGSSNASTATHLKQTKKNAN